MECDTERIILPPTDAAPHCHVFVERTEHRKTSIFSESEFKRFAELADTSDGKIKIMDCSSNGKEHWF